MKQFDRSGRETLWAAGRSSSRVTPGKEHHMLRWALICLIIALVASALGMYGLEGTAMEAARILFFVFLVLIIVGLITGRRTPLA
jgi:uncharacterized membrane protein YtjA (UPF0391 family)